MTDLNWRIKGIQLVNCNCAWGCPCQFSGRPTKGQCEAVWAMRTDEGHFGDVRLDGLKWGMLFWWPGAVHEGNGKRQLFGEDRATVEQREALETIAHGQVSDEGTYFQIFAAVTPNVQPSVWAPVEFECDIDKRTGRLTVGDLVETNVEPLRNPVTHAEQRARVLLPDGFEYREAEYASGTAISRGPIALNQQGTHAHLYRSAWDAHGISAG